MNRTIGDIMERDAYTCRYDQNLGEVVTLFNELGTSGLVVIDEDRHVVGFISDGDIMKAVAAQKTRSIFSGGYSNIIGMVRRATITRYLFDVLFGEEEPSAE